MKRLRTGLFSFPPYKDGLQVQSSIKHLTTSTPKQKQESPKARRKVEGSGKRWLSYQPEGGLGEANSSSPSAIRERNKAVSSYYNQDSIDTAAQKPSVRLTPSTIMYSSRSSDKHTDALRSAQYLHKELPIRVAHRIAGFRSLPFIIGCNPTILSVHELYIRAFHILNDLPEMHTDREINNFNKVLRALLDDHKEVVSQLAQGFKESRKHVQDDNVVAGFLDRTLTSRLGIRMLVHHHLLLQDSRAGNIGMINLNMNLRELTSRWSAFVTEIAVDKYGHAPQIKISGHSPLFPYIEMPLDYILPELLKNAVRAVIESNPGLSGKSLPPIHITLASNNTDFIIRISDRGGGIPHAKLASVMRYNFTTAEESTEETLNNQGIFANMMEEVNRTTSGPMHGFGFGLPTSSAYAQYLGGSLEIQSLQGYGTDVFLRLKHLESENRELRI